MTTAATETPWVPRDPDGFVTLQGMVRTEQGICTERDLYLRTEGLAAYSESAGQVSLAEGARLLGNTWFNLFNLGKWRSLCALEDLHLRLEGRGRMELKVFAAFPDRSWECAACEEIVLEPGRPLRFELSHVLGLNDRAIAYFELRALEDGCLFLDAAWQTRQAPQRSPELMLSITTFRREQAVQATVRRFETFLPNSSLRDNSPDRRRQRPERRHRKQRPCHRDPEREPRRLGRLRARAAGRAGPGRQPLPVHG